MNKPNTLQEIEKIITHPILCNYPNLEKAEADVKTVAKQIFSKLQEAYDKGYSDGHKDNMKIMGMKIPDNVRIAKLHKQKEI